MPLVNATPNGRYIGIKSDGKFHEKVDENTPGAVLRKYEVKDKHGNVTTGEKWELLYRAIEKMRIVKIEFETGEYGENILTTFSDGEEEITWSEGTGTNFGTDYMKKLPNVDFSYPVAVMPYSFEDERGKERRGVSIYQNGDKIVNFFWDAEAATTCNGFPQPEGDKEMYDSDDWKVYFIGVRKFLVAHIKEHVVPKVLEAEPKEWPSEAEIAEKFDKTPQDDVTYASSMPTIEYPEGGEKPPF